MYEELNIIDELLSNKQNQVSHNSVLNCLFILQTNNNKLFVYDCNTRTYLTKIDLNNYDTAAARCNNKVKIVNIQDKCLIIGDRTLCVRTSYDGIYYLDSVFQVPVRNHSSTANAANAAAAVGSTEQQQQRILLELTINDSLLLLNGLKSIEVELIHGLDDIVSQINKQFNAFKLSSDPWDTIKIVGNYNTLMSVFSQSLEEIKRINMQSLGIPILSALIDRLYRLDANNSESMQTMLLNYDKRFMCSEANRRATFHDWPHMDYKWVLPDSLAQAGFYHQPSQPNDDRTMCFVCSLCLVAWEQSDQPWSEHERHSPICQFVRGEITENVPLSTTTATQAAIQVFKNEIITCTSELSSDRYFAVSDQDGHIVVYDTKDLVREMMHVQLVNESEYNKSSKLQIHSLCFYYRNHKHVLYGSFTINDEVFIFSFNIFDIYRSYQSKSSKKSSKLHKSTKSSDKKSSSTTITTATTATNTTAVQTTAAPLPPPPPVPSSTTTITPASDKPKESLVTNNETENQPPPLTNEDEKIKNENKIEQKESEATTSTTTATTTTNETQQSSKIEDESINKQLKKHVSIDSSSSKETASTTAIVAEPTSSTVKKSYFKINDQTATSTTTTATNLFGNQIHIPSNGLFTISFGAGNGPVSNNIDTTPFNPITLTQYNAAAALNSLTYLNDLNLNTATLNTAKKQLINQNTNINATSGNNNSNNNNSSNQNTNNLSNFLIVKFEICSNNESTSKSKSKYKKCIKILSVNAKVIDQSSNNNVNTNTSNNDSEVLAPPLIQKTYEFTEKCLSFRLALIDYSLESHTNYTIKLVNLYDKSLFAIVNYLLPNSNNLQTYKFYQIKHEENSSSSSTSSQSKQQQPTASFTTPVTQQPQQQISLNDSSSSTTSVPPAVQQQQQTVLSATSSSRLNLTELQIANMPITNKKVISLISLSVTTYEEDVDIRLIATLDTNGVISIIDPFKLQKVCEFESPSQTDKFTTISYCYGIDKICAISETGKIYMIYLRVPPIVNDVDLLMIKTGYASANNGDESLSEITSKLLVDTQLRHESLSLLQNLIYFESIKTNFSAKFPSCWQPVLPEQHQQRKHPQHILAESQNYTKSWKYLNNGTTSSSSSTTSTNSNDEILIEIYLNKPIQIGCVQLKLKFNKELHSPFELKLYKQKFNEPSTTTQQISVDTKIDFNLNNSKHEILFGPIDVRDYLDVTGTRTCVITICSHKLLETRTNLYFLSLRSTSKDMGGDNVNILQKVFITLRKYKRTGLPNERVERSLMLTKIPFFKKLIAYILQSSENEQLKAIDILNWIIYNHLTQSSMLNTLKQILLENLEQLLRIFYLNSNRSISRKATLMLTFMLNPLIDTNKEMGAELLDKLLNNLNYLPYFESSASMYWYFMLLHQVMLINPSKSHDKCMQMLNKLSKSHKYNPYYALLKMRYNYTCLPFESQLFDVDLYFKFDLNNPKFMSTQQLYQQQQNNSVGVNAANAPGGTSQQAQQNILQLQAAVASVALNTNYLFGFNNPLQPQQFMSFNNFTNNGAGQNGAGQINMNLNTKLDNLMHEIYNIMPQIVGLLEVLPLNFKCVSSSQGTTIEKTNSKQDLSLYMLPNCNTLFSNPNNMNQTNSQNPATVIASTDTPTTATTTTAATTTISATTSDTSQLAFDTGDKVDSKNLTEPSTPKNTPFPGQTPPNEPNTNCPTTANSLNAAVAVTVPNIDTSIFNSIFSFQSMQLLVIERMEPVSRHSVVLDFGFTVALTDIMIPACAELSSLSIDVWTHKEQKDSKRICVSTEINETPILLNDLQPAPICRYLKLIMVAHSSNIVKAKIPIGFYFGYPYIFQSETHDDNVALLNNNTIQMSNAKSNLNYLNVTSHLNYLEKLYEDSQCHYSMSIGKLRKLLNEIKYPNDNIGHLKMMQFTYTESADLTNKIKDAYNECLDYQFQLNLNRQMIKLLRNSLGLNKKTLPATIESIDNDNYEKLIQQIPQDQLRITNSLLVKTLICLTSSLTCVDKPLSDKLNLDQALGLFRNLCVNSNLEKECSWLLLRTCYNESWWGEFISSCLKIYFVNQIKEVMPLSRIFITLNDICLKSLNGTQTMNLFKSIFKLIIEILESLNTDDEKNVEITSLEWLLLFVSRLLSVLDKTKNEITNRWEFLENIYTNHKTSLSNTSKSSFSLRNSKSKLKKKLFQSNKYFTWSKLKETRKNFDKYKSKNIWKDDLNNLNNDGNKSNNMSSKRSIQLPRDCSLNLCKLLIKLLVNANSYCSSDLFVLSCRILSSICFNSQPSISLNEIISKTNLNKLLMLCVGAEFNHGSVCWGSPWSPHAILSLLMDIIENERLNMSNENLLLQQAQQQQLDSANSLIISEQDENFNGGAKIIELTEDNQIVSSIKSTISANNNSSTASALSPASTLDFSKKFPKLSNILNVADKQIPQFTSDLSDPFLTDLNEKFLTQKELEEMKNTFAALKQNAIQYESIALNAINKSSSSTNNNSNRHNLQSSNGNSSYLSKLTMSYDLRLDTSVFQTIENYLFIKSCLQIEHMNRSICEPLPPSFLQQQKLAQSQANNDAAALLSAAGRSYSIYLIQDTIEDMFSNLDLINIENLLSFWLTLSISDPSEIRFDVSKEPIVQLKDETVLKLIDYLLSYPYMTVKLWYLAFRSLTMLLNQSTNSTKQSNLLRLLCDYTKFYKLLYKFISSNHELVGDECCQAFVECLKRYLSLIKYNKYEQNLVKRKLFELICESISYNGCMNRSQGPLDAQISFIEYLNGEDILISFDYDNLAAAKKSILVKYLKNLSFLVKAHICVYPRLSIKGVTSPRSCFSTFLSSLLGNTTAPTPNALFKTQLNHPFGPSFASFATTATQANTQSKHQQSYHASKYDSMASSMPNCNSKSSNSQPVLCNRDILICLLLKFAVNLLTKQTTSTTSIPPPPIPSLIGQSNQSSDLTNSSATIKTYQIYPPPIMPSIFSTSNTNNTSSNNPQNLNDDSFYDIFTQQMLLYELQLDENEQLDQELADQYSLLDQQCEDFDESSIEEGRYKLEQQQQQEPLEQEQQSHIVSVFDVNPESEQQTPTSESIINSKKPQSPSPSPTPLAAPSTPQQSQTVTADETTIKRMQLINSLSDECLETYIESLGLCQSSALAMVISNSGYPIDFYQNNIQTPGDGLFLLLKSMQQLVPLKLITATYTYLQKLKRLSEPLLWFISHLFTNENALKSFIDKNGVDIISKGLQSTTRQLLYSGPCIISSLMNHIDSERQQVKATNNIENDSTEGFTNFAPFSSIICTSPGANPVDVLVQTTVPHRRMRSAVWSHHFQPDEHKVSLFLTFPYTFLLKEVHIVPHTVSFCNCPAYVSIEVSRDGSFMSPIGPPVYTIGMSSIKLQLNKSELVSAVQINLYKSKDSQIIGLSQIKLLGYPMFENMLSAKPDMMLTPIEDLVSRSNMGWLRLLYMCMTSTHNGLDQIVCEKLNENTVHLCTHLLASPAMIIYDKLIETILIKLSKYSLKRNLEITKCLLNAENGFNNGLYSMPHGILMETIVNIFYQISEIQPIGAEQQTTNAEYLRVKLILDWLLQCASSEGIIRLPSNMLLHCVSCILYKAKQIPEINEDLIKTLANYSIKIQEYYTKQAIDWILCSLLYQKPELIATLTSLIDLSKLKMSYTDKQETLALVETISYAIQSKNCIKLFIDSQFFQQFVAYYLDLMQREPQYQQYTQQSETPEVELSFLKVFIALADYADGQEWLGSDVGCQVWKSSLNILCCSVHSTMSRSEELSLLIIQLIKKMLFCNQTNQNLFARYVTQLIKDLATTTTTNNQQEPSLSAAVASAQTATISGFLHQLILQVLLEDQTITVNFIRKSDLFKTVCNSSLGLLTHPRFGTGNNCRTIELPLSKTCSQLAHLITEIPMSHILQSNSVTQQQQQPQISQPAQSSSLDHNTEMGDILGKLKASYDQLNRSSKPQNYSYPRVKLYLKELSNDKYLPNECTLAHMVNAYLNKTKEKTIQDLTINVGLVYLNQLQGSSEELEYKDVYHLNELQERDVLNNVTYSPLDAFVKCDGLIVLAERLPIVMPFIHEPLLNITDKDRAQTHSSQEQSGAKTSPDFVDYVIMNESDEPFDDEMYGDMPMSNTQTNSNKLKKITMPPHAFIAFGLFLKIPGYANVMLRNKRQAQCILKLLLGANRNKDDEFGISLSTMPFSSLKELLNDTRLSSSQTVKADLCRFIVENRILTLILSILSSLSHHQHKQNYPHFMQQIIPESISFENAGLAQAQANGANATYEETASQSNQTNKNNNLYWAKGTGFGTGSTIQQWDAERTLMQQKMEEEHVTCILQILSNYIKCFEDDQISELVIELFDHSCIMSALSSYLRNDSVLDMSRHVPLYKASLELLQSLVTSKQLRELVYKCKMLDLLKNMKQFVDCYTSRIKLADEEGGLTCLVPVLEDTYNLMVNLIKPQDRRSSEFDMSDATNASIEKLYCDTMKELQFDTYGMVNDTSGSIKMNVPYYYESSLIDMANTHNPHRAKRLAQETVTLSNSLPLSYSSSVFVRCDEERLDVMKVLITGPQDTPYSNGCFEFDVFFPSDYPDSPPLVNLQTTGNQTVRFNPNLYHDGKVCLSILNTWHGRPEERWNSQTSSFLQVLVSIQSLILVSEPYFNEPGYERSRGTPAGTASSIEHDANIRQATVKWGMLEMVKKPSVAFKDVIKNHFFYKRKEIKAQCDAWAKELEQYIHDKQIGQSVSKSYLALKRHMAQLYEELDKLEINTSSNDLSKTDNS